MDRQFETNFNALTAQGAGFRATGVVLAGGKSTRMGANKSLAMFRGQTMVDIAANRFRQPLRHDAPSVYGEIIISANTPDDYAATGLPVVQDFVAGQGPIGGILACLLAARHEYVSFAPTDTPRIPDALPRLVLSAAIGHDAAVPVFGGRPEPLLACFRKTAAKAVALVESSHERNVRQVFDSIDTAYVDLAALAEYLGDPKEYLRNVNDSKTLKSLERNAVWEHWNRVPKALSPRRY